MSRRTFLASGCAAALASLTRAPARAQALDAPLRIVVGYAPGGPSDRTARLIADALMQRLGSTVRVENRPGAGGRVAAQHVAAASADDHVLLLGNAAVNVLAPLVYGDVGYDAVADFVPIAQLTQHEFAVAVSHKLSARTAVDLLAWMRANPLAANVAISATGGLAHLFVIALGEAAGVGAQPVGYRGSARLVTDLVGAQVPIAIDLLDMLLPLHDAGKLRIVAVGSEARSPLVPQIGTLKEAGIDASGHAWTALFAPAAMPATRRERIADAAEAAMRDPIIQRRFRSASMTPVAATADQTARMVALERDRLERAWRTSSISP